MAAISLSLVNSRVTTNSSNMVIASCSVMSVHFLSTPLLYRIGNIHDHCSRSECNCPIAVERAWPILPRQDDNYALLGQGQHQGRHQCLCQEHGGAPDRARYSRQCSSAGTGVDAFESVRSGTLTCQGRRVRQNEPDGQAGTAGGNRAGLCIPRIGSGFLVHHRDHSPCNGRGNERIVARMFSGFATRRLHFMS